MRNLAHADPESAQLAHRIQALESSMRSEAASNAAAFARIEASLANLSTLVRGEGGVGEGRTSQTSVLWSFCVRNRVSTDFGEFYKVLASRRGGKMRKNLLQNVQEGEEEDRECLKRIRRIGMKGIAIGKMVLRKREEGEKVRW